MKRTGKKTNANKERDVREWLGRKTNQVKQCEIFISEELVIGEVM